MGIAVMCLIYIAGIISGAVLVGIALIGWIKQAAAELKEKGQYGQAPRPGARADAGTAPVADYGAYRRRRRDRSATRAA